MEDKKYIYFVGCNVPKHPMKWSVVGLFDREEDAIAACTYISDFYCKLEMNQILGDCSEMDVIRPKLKEKINLKEVNDI